MGDRAAMESYAAYQALDGKPETEVATLVNTIESNLMELFNLAAVCKLPEAEQQKLVKRANELKTVVEAAIAARDAEKDSSQSLDAFVAKTMANGVTTMDTKKPRSAKKSKEYYTNNDDVSDDDAADTNMQVDAAAAATEPIQSKKRQADDAVEAESAGEPDAKKAKLGGESTEQLE